MSKIKLIPSKVNLITLDDFITRINNINKTEVGDTTNHSYSPSVGDTINHKNLTSLGFVSNKDIKDYYYINIDKIFIKTVVVQIAYVPTILFITCIRYNKNGDIIKVSQSKVNSLSTLSGNIQKSLNLLKNG